MSLVRKALSIDREGGFSVRTLLAVLLLLLAMSASVFAQTPVPPEDESGRALPVILPKSASLQALRAAETAAGSGRIEDAARIYSELAGAETVSREVLLAAAVGLYRTGAFRESVQAFRRFGTFAKGEEDLRYYYAVVLFETGRYADAQKELACALPFIEVTDEVSRTRAKIENMLAASLAAGRNAAH